MMGLGEKSLIGVKADDNRRMDVDDLQKYLYERVINERERSVSMTHVNGKSALRFLILTPEQDVNDIINTFDYLRRLALQFENKT